MIRGKTTIWLPIFILICFFVYFKSDYGRGISDSKGTALVPIVLLTKGNLIMNDFQRHYQEELNYISTYFFHPTKSGYISSYPIASGVLLTPLYIIPVSIFKIAKPTIGQWVLFAEKAENFFAALITAASVVLFYLIMVKQKTSKRVAFLLMLAYAFGSSALSSTSRSLWQHTTGIFFILLTILVCFSIIENPKYKKALLLGLLLGILVAIRPLNVIFAGSLFFWVVFYYRKHFWLCLSASAPIIILLIWYNLKFFDTLSGFYPMSAFGGNFWSGLKGVLFSPSRGLFMYFPLAIFGISGFVWILKRTNNNLRGLYIAFMVSIVLQTIAVSLWQNWWGGFSFGPRLLSEIQPFLLVLSVPFLSNEKKIEYKWLIFYVMLVLSCLIHFTAVLSPTPTVWNYRPVSVDKNPQRLWDWSDSQITRTFRQIYYQKESNKILKNWNAIYDTTEKSINANSEENTMVNITVTNTSTERWSSEGKYPIHLSYHLLDAQMNMLVFDGVRTFMSDASIEPGQVTTFSLLVKAPTQKGTYWVLVSLVQEAGGWFNDKGVPPLKVKMEVH